MELERSFEIEVVAPGKMKEDFTIELDRETLIISCGTNGEKTAAKGKFTRREFLHSAFKRSFALAESAKAEDTKASYENGILKISIPKREEALPQPKRQIEIS